MLINLFGVRQGRSPDVEWFHNPHHAVARCEELNLKKIIWLCYDTERSRSKYNSKAWQVIHNLSHFRRRVLPGFARAHSPVWKDEPRAAAAVTDSSHS